MDSRLIIHFYSFDGQILTSMLSLFQISSIIWNLKSLGSPTAQRFPINWILWSALRRRSDARCPGAFRIGPRISKIRSQKSVGSLPQFPRHSRVRRGRQEKTPQARKIRRVNFLCTYLLFVSKFERIQKNIQNFKIRALTYHQFFSEKYLIILRLKIFYSSKLLRLAELFETYSNLEV